MSKTEVDIFYLCDRKACENCHDECKHTGDISHAANKRELPISLFSYSNIDGKIAFFEEDLDEACEI